LYVIGSDTTKYLAAFDAASGKKNWSKTTTNFLQRQVVAGDKIYAIKQSSYPGNAGTSSILIYNALNGNIKDSISLSGNSFGFPMVLTANGKFLVNNVY
jgi:outer membrane protein assembly factor BamB